MTSGDDIGHTAKIEAARRSMRRRTEEARRSDAPLLAEVDRLWDTLMDELVQEWAEPGDDAMCSSRSGSGNVIPIRLRPSFPVSKSRPVASVEKEFRLAAEDETRVQDSSPKSLPDLPPVARTWPRVATEQGCTITFDVREDEQKTRRDKSPYRLSVSATLRLGVSQAILIWQEGAVGIFTHHSGELDLGYIEDFLENPGVLTSSFKEPGFSLVVNEGP